MAGGLTTKSLLSEALGFLQKTCEDRTSDSGEFAEFLLYVFVKEVKGGHKLATKISARGSDTMTIPGRDNTYAWKDSSTGDIYMFLGEAKSTPDSNDGLRAAQFDINKFWGGDKIRHEVRLASNHIRSEMNDDNLDIYEAYFIDDNPAHTELKYKNVIFVAYSLDAFAQVVKKTITQDSFVDILKSDMERCFKNQKDLINACPHNSIYCFLPFECIDNARETFAKDRKLTF